MNPKTTSTATARGTGRFRLGLGPEATCGDVELLLEVYAGSEASVTVLWSVPGGWVPDEARERIVSYLNWYLEDYLSRESVGALLVNIVAAGWSNEQCNEPERAAFIAVHQAMTNAKLPHRLLFEPPADGL